MYAYSLLQEAEFAAESRGYTSIRHQREVGVGYFDAISTALGSTSTAAMAGSTEEEQF
jgi:isocitrate lyase